VAKRRGRRANIKIWKTIIEAFLKAPFNELWNSELADITGLSKPALRYYTRKLEENGFIIDMKTYPKRWKLTPKGKQAFQKMLKFGGYSNYFNLGSITGGSNTGSVPPSPQTSGNLVSVHNVKVVIPIIERGYEVEGGIEKKAKHWRRKYYYELLEGVTIEDTGKNLVLHIHEFKVPLSPKATSEIISRIMEKVTAVITFFEVKQKWKLGAPEVKHQEIQLPTPEPLKERLPKGVTVTTGRKATTPTGELNREEKVWIDDTPEEGGTESNSLRYFEDYAKMPIRVRRILALMGSIAKTMEVLGRHIPEQTKALYTLVNIIQNERTTEAPEGKPSLPSFPGSKAG